MKNFLKFGNHKLGDDTAIFNMSSAQDCPSKQLGMCEVINKGYRCYADKAETQYGDAVINARVRQGSFWRLSSEHEILQLISEKIKRRKKDTRYLRFNESGDFHDQCDIRKLSYISSGLKTIGITTYGYTARNDLDFRDANFYVKGSGWNHESLTGTTTIIKNKEDLPESTKDNTWILCPNSCKTCNICKINTKINVAFLYH